MCSVRIGAIMGKAVLAAVLPLAMAGHANAAMFQITMQTSGTGYFQMDGMFDEAGPASGGQVPYTMRMIATLTDPVADHSGPTSKWWSDSDASVRVDLEVGGVVYTTIQQDRYVRLSHAAGRSGAPYEVLEMYAELLPHSVGNSASLSHTIHLAPGLLPFSDIIEPMAFATPDVLQTRIDGGVYIIYEDVFVQVGTLGAYGQQTSVSVTAVPEPGTYAMTLLGCAVLAGAGALRARRAG
ncbi:putative secreted protein with PEP-CTERM sorting signal [Pseudoduganella flava]|nr:putative secreted protein with PEP-CTERM sorting signal [Pseudoduganella flava]